MKAKAPLLLVKRNQITYFQGHFIHASPYISDAYKYIYCQQSIGRLAKEKKEEDEREPQETTRTEQSGSDQASDPIVEQSCQKEDESVVTNRVHNCTYVEDEEYRQHAERKK